MVQTSIGHYYQHLLTHLVKLMMDKLPPEDIVQKKTMEFSNLEVKWPVIKPLNSKSDAVETFKLGNT
jgi:hypothetical protein